MGKISAYLSLAVVIILFIMISFIGQYYLEYFKNFIGREVFGIVSYILVIIFLTILAPLSSLPLIPLGSALFGPFFNALFNIVSWSIASATIFFICRKYGVPIVKRIVSLDKIKKAEEKISEKREFWSLVFLRMVIPVDILSYALGLFSKISFSRYILSTIIGITPFAFVFSYLGSFPVIWQLLGLGIALILILTGIAINRRRNSL